MDQRRIERMRERAQAQKAESCPNTDSGPCRLDMRKHYHLALYPRGEVVAIKYGSPEDYAAFPPDGLTGLKRTAGWHAPAFTPIDMPPWIEPLLTPFRDRIARPTHLSVFPYPS
jgi:hypothetical protein